MADALEAYLDALGEALRFDPPLADRVVEEIGDHLDCALAAELSCADSESDGDADAARARVIARFGAPRRIAGQFVAMALEANADRLWRLAALTAAVSFAAMRLRALHLDPVEAAGDGLAVAALMLDRGAFIAALALGLWGWWLARDARRSWRPDPGGWRRLFAGLRLSALALAALMLSVAADTALTLPRLMEAAGGVFWPAAALTVEIALVLALAIAVSRSREQAAALRRLLF
jgi:hypothetical protein